MSGEGEVGHTWSPERWPTADEWRAWFLGCPDWQQREIADRIVLSSQRAARCFDQNHDDLDAQLARVRALADEWERDTGPTPMEHMLPVDFASDLRAMLAPDAKPTPEATT